MGAGQIIRTLEEFESKKVRKISLTNRPKLAMMYKVWGLLVPKIEKRGEAFMPGLVVFGSQWGDEGKGRFVDYLAGKADMVIRYQGGNNAGHTVYANGKEFKLRTIPSGIISEHTPCVIGNGVVIDPGSLLKEIEYVRERGVSAENLHISDRAHIIMPYHRVLDSLSEKKLGDKKIGTTGNGIGPCYTDKTSRVGFRMCDLLDPEGFAARLKTVLADKNELITKIYDGDALDYEEILEQYLDYGKKLAPMIEDTSLLVYDYMKKGKKLLFEGAQGMLLDLDYGTYPYVTSSHPTAGGVPAGAGVGPQTVTRVVGAVKSYTTRVGEGPFTTELFDEMGDAIRNKGHEFGTVTGRPRRCGWLDLVILRFAARISGITDFAVSRMDTLGGFDKVKVCVAYECDGKRYDNYPASLTELSKMKPVYEELPGWSSDISNVRRFEDLPEGAQNYIRFIEKQTGVPVAMIGVGPSREECVVLKDLYAE